MEGSERAVLTLIATLRMAPAELTQPTRRVYTEVVAAVAQVHPRAVQLPAAEPEPEVADTGSLRRRPGAVRRANLKLKLPPRPQAGPPSSSTQAAHAVHDTSAARRRGVSVGDTFAEGRGSWAGAWSVPGGRSARAPRSAQAPPQALGSEHSQTQATPTLQRPAGSELWTQPQPRSRRRLQAAEVDVETAVSTSAAALDAVLARIVAGLKPGLAARGIDLARISVQGKALAVSEHFLPLTSEPAPDTPSAHVRGLSSAALAGVILGAVVLLLALAGGVAVWRREERREATERRLRPANEHQAELHRLGPADDEAPPDLADPQPTPAC
eukprot:1333244-Rhodomonas_salina.1